MSWRCGILVGSVHLYILDFINVRKVEHIKIRRKEVREEDMKLIIHF